MKRLLLMLIFFPVALFCQTRKENAVDSIKAAAVANQKVISSLLSNSPGNRVDNVRVVDSGEYVTVVFRINLADLSSMANLPIVPVRDLKSVNTTDEISSFTVLPLPRAVPEKEEFAALLPVSVADMEAGPTAFSEMSLVTIAPLPRPVAEKDTIVSLFSAAAVRLETREAAYSRMDTVAAPPLPEVLSELDALPLAKPIKLFAYVPIHRMDTMEIRSFAEKKLPVQELHLSAEGYSLLEKLEGFSPELYSLKDGGFTIGFGFFVPYGEGQKWDRGVSWEQAERLIKQKMPQYEDQVKKYINVPLTQNEFDALTMLAYNIGGFSKATSIVNDINDQADFHKLQSDWTRFVHSKAPNVTRGLLNRRRDELGVKKEANYQPERKIQILRISK